MSLRKKISIVVPMHNEESNVNFFFERILCVVTGLDVDYEVICVNDGSKDNTLQKLIEQHKRNVNIKVIDFSRNFGKEVAMSAGIDYTQGDAVIPIDADLQDPPELIGDFIRKWNDGYDIVYATRTSRAGESWVKKTTANLFYRVIEKITDIRIPRNTGDFRLMDRRVVNVLKQLPERTRFMKGLFAWVGFKQTSILYDRHPRYAGATNWNYWKLWNFALDGIASFSSLPLKIWSYIGILFSLCAFLYIAVLIVRSILIGVDVPGYTSLMVVMLFIGGIQLISLGVIGEYLGRVYIEVKDRPLYVVSNLYGLEKHMCDNEE